MVRRFWSIIGKEVGNLHEAAYLLGFFALISQLLGLLRDRLFAAYFGAGAELDIYYAAFRIPDLIFVSIASLVSVSVLVPFLIERLDKNPEEGKRFIDGTFSFFFALISVVSLAVFFLVPVLVPILLPGFKDSPSLETLIMLTRILLLSPLLLGISNFMASITQVYNRFLIYALSPLLYNLGIIAGTIFFYPVWGIAGLGWGVVAGALGHLAIQLPFVLWKRLFPKLTFKVNFASVKKVVFHSLPRTITLSANQIATFVLVALASVMSKGSIAVFNLAFNLQSFPLAIVGVSYSSAAFPALSRLFSSGNREKFVEQVVVSARHIIFWSVPIMVLFVVLRAQIVRTVLGAGNFSWTDTRLTAAALALFTLSVVPQALIMLFVRAYYSSGNTKKPLVINLLSSAFIIACGYGGIVLYEMFPVFRYFIESLLKVPDVPGSVVLVLPFAYSAGVIINTALHWYVFEKEFKNFSNTVMSTLFQSLSASIIMGYAAYLSLNIFDDVFNLDTLPGIFLQGLCSGVIGIIVGVVVLKLLKSRELSEVWATLHRKIWRVKVIPPEQSSLQNPL